MGFLIPHITNPYYMFLNKMLIIAAESKHGAAIKVLMSEIRKQAQPAIANSLKSLGTHMPNGVVGIIADYVACAKQD
jgi:hypothetical protein